MHYVLVVCDDDEDIEFLKQAFHAQPGKIPVNSLDSGRKLLEHLSTRPLYELPFLVVLDQYLSDIDSLTLVSDLRKQEQSRLIPVAVMSGFASDELIREYYRAGANCFCKKPYDPADWSHMADCLVTLFLNHH
jgi:CheY-like chemotaxis protein